MTTVWQALQQALSPVEERPRLVDNIESATYKTPPGTPDVVIYKPAEKRYARLDPRENDLLPLMDGRHSVEDLVIAYYRNHCALAPARVASLVQLLRNEGFLQPRIKDAYAALADRIRGPRGRAVQI